VTAPDPYTQRLKRLTDARWKQVVNVQAPYRWNLRRLAPGHVLDVGCGIGRNLQHLDGNGVGVDTSQASVDVARTRGWTAHTVDEFPSSPEAIAGAYDSLLIAHVLEHMPREDAEDLVRNYLPYLRAGGQVIVIVPQEVGYASDDTHVNFLEADDVVALLASCGVSTVRNYSFPFPRIVGRVFRHNETVVVGRLEGTPPV
jgi:SAM-dependent methyltransferase